MKRSKGISKTPKSIYNVSIVRKAGSPKFREGQGDGVLIVVVGVTPHQGDGKADHRAKRDRKVNLLRLSMKVSRNATDDH